MDAQVALQLPGVYESVAANFALKALVAEYHLLVPDQAGSGLVGFLALVAAERPLIGMGAFVLLQLPGVHQTVVALIALVWFIAVVKLLMPDQARPELESFLALVAFEGSFVRMDALMALQFPRV